MSTNTENGLIYLDNAATSFPKPESVMQAMSEFAMNIGANPGRSGHRKSVEAGRIVYEAREKLAGIIKAPDPLRIAFTLNATMSLNFALQGFLKPGDHVITSSMEHNSVARNLRFLESRGVELTRIGCDQQNGRLDVDVIRQAIRKNTKAFVVMHASNVTGRIFPIRDIGGLAKEKDIVLIVDAAQTAGAIPVNVIEEEIDILAVTGHKSLLGPQGTGALYVREGIELSPLLHGGTGSRSEEDQHPLFMPDCFEAGTPNTIGIAGLAAGLGELDATGITRIREVELELSRLLIHRLEGHGGIRIYGRQDAVEKYLPVFSLAINGWPCSSVAQTLDEEFGIMVRSGLHCAPWAHETLGTYPDGLVRLSAGAFSTTDDINRVADALIDISNRKPSSAV